MRTCLFAAGVCLLGMLCMTPAHAQQQGQTITGTVLDDSREPLPGVSVTVKGATVATLTDGNGRYSITVPGNDAVLVYSFLGFAPQEIKVGVRAVIDVTLKEDVKIIDEVVVVGYGTQKKRDLTGAVSSVKVAEMPVQVYSTVSHALAGKAAGLQVMQTSAQPGGAAKFRIRGETSTGAGNEPLVIIDGFPVSQTDAETSGDIGFYNGHTDNILGSLNPNDVESIEILKDASATAIYGSRAGHGVIIVTTKRGAKNQKLNVNYSGNVSVQQIRENYRMLSAKGFMKARNLALYEDYLKTNAQGVYANYITLDAGHVTRPFTPKYSDALIARTEGTDWMGEIMRTGMQQSHNLSMTGGNGGTQYMASVNYFDQEGIIKEDGMDRFSARLNLDQQISRFVKAGITLSLSRNKYHSVPLDYGSNDENRQYDGVIKTAAEFNPTLPLYDRNGDYTKDPDRPNVTNPVSLLTVTDNSVKDRVLGSAYVEVEPVKGLLLKASLGMDRRNGKRSVYMPRTVTAGAQVNGKANISERDNIDYLMDLTATWAKKIGEHSFTALAGYSYQQFNTEGFSAGNQMFLMDNFLYNNLGSGAGEKPNVASWADKSALGSYFARVNYSFLGRYLLTATIRADGDSDFNPDYRWGYFPSASVGWRFSDEAFMQPFSSWLSNGKIRGGYGQTGNSNVGNRIIDFYEADSWTVFGDSQAIGVRAGQLGNPRLRWETTTEWNIGLDLGFFDGRLNVAAEYYDRVISDLLVGDKSLPSYNEITSIAANIGKTQGQGVELTLNTVNLKGRDLEWSTDLTWSFYRDRWLERDPEWKPAPYELATDPIRSFYTTLTDGLMQAGEVPPAHQPNLLPGQVKIIDISGPNGEPDGKLDQYDMVYLGSKDPDFYFGINNTLRYKNFDLNIYFYGTVNQQRWYSYYEEIAISTDSRNVSILSPEVWYHDNQGSQYPSIIGSDYGVGGYYSKKISYLRCRNITLGYVVPLSKKIVERMRVYVDVNNPFIITNYTGADPETDGLDRKLTRGSASVVYPNVTTFTFGVDITF